METLLGLSVAMAAGLLMSRLAKVLRLPAVTAYLVAGILIGPYLLGSLGIPGFGYDSMDELGTLDVILDVALGFIAFQMGDEFRMEDLRQIGAKCTVIAVIQALTATLFVDLALLALSAALGPDVFPPAAAIVLGAIATATAPAATLMVVKQYKASGPLTKLLLPIVALDDGVGLVVFAISFGIARAMLHGAISIVSVLVEPLLEIVLSLALGAALGMLFHWMEKFFHSNSKRLSISILFVLMAVGLSALQFSVFGVNIAFSSLLVCMMMGTVFCNLCDFSHELMERADSWSQPVLILFFVLSGAELELGVFASGAVVLVGVVYILSRSAGKIVGAWGSCHLMHEPKPICRNLGITLLPQAGVSLGMSLTAMTLGGDIGSLVRNVTLFGVLIYELVGPLLTKQALMRVGEITEKPVPKRVAEGKRLAEEKKKRKQQTAQ